MRLTTLFLLFILLHWFGEAFAEKKLFVLLGQSNMAGRASIEIEDFRVIENAFLLNDHGEFELAKNPLNRYSNIRKADQLQRLGLGYSFSREMSRIYPNDSIYLIVNARGGTPIQDFSKGAPTGYYKQTINRIKKALADDPKLQLVSIIWHQGESNRNDPKEYIELFSELMSNYRTDLRRHELPVFAGQLGQWHPDYNEIRAELEKLKELKNVWLVPSERLTNFDEHHFDANSQRKFGRRYARVYAKAIDGLEINNVYWLKRSLTDPDSNDIMVVAHRGDWRNYPENSIPAIQSCIDMGVDMVELDVGMTRDSVLILMHDKTLDRTTTGNGKVSDFTYEEIMSLQLRDGARQSTEWKVPTLKGALSLCSGKILINLDKSDIYIDKIYPMLNEIGCRNQVVIGSYQPYDSMKEITGPYLDSIYFMPKIKEESVDVTSFLEGYFTSLIAPIVHMNFSTDSTELLNYVDDLRMARKRVWTNAITAIKCAYHHDDRATYDLSGSYRILVDLGFNVIQTDRPQLLIKFLRENDLHE